MIRPYFVTLRTRHEQIAWAEADDLGGALQAVVTLWDESQEEPSSARIDFFGRTYAEIYNPELCRWLLGPMSHPEFTRRIRRPGAALKP